MRSLRGWLSIPSGDTGGKGQDELGLDAAAAPPDPAMVANGRQFMADHKRIDVPVAGSGRVAPASGPWLFVDGLRLTGAELLAHYRDRGLLGYHCVHCGGQIRRTEIHCPHCYACLAPQDIIEIDPGVGRKAPATVRFTEPPPPATPGRIPDIAPAWLKLGDGRILRGDDLTDYYREHGSGGWHCARCGGAIQPETIHCPHCYVGLDLRDDCILNDVNAGAPSAARGAV